MKTKNIFLTVALALFTTFAFAQISTTKHNFAAAAWNGSSSGEICNACHTPHNANVKTAAPLWSRIDFSPTFTAYSSTTFTANVAGSGSGGGAAVAYTTTPSGVSLLCLSCHDGVNKLDAAGVIATDMNDINALAIRDGGTNEHPISIDYTAELIALDGGLHDIATATPRLSAAGTVECSSCHDVHNADNINSGVYLLAASNAGSAMCLTCHDK